jgi:hypothetical protein
MNKFSKLNENYEKELLKNKIINKSNLIINIKCDFCGYVDEYSCENNVVDKEEWWLSSENFIHNGWDELITPEKKGISCPNCIQKWKDGKWYHNN